MYIYILYVYISHCNLHNIVYVSTFNVHMHRNNHSDTSPECPDLRPEDNVFGYLYPASLQLPAECSALLWTETWPGGWCPKGDTQGSARVWQDSHTQRVRATVRGHKDSWWTNVPIRWTNVPIRCRKTLYLDIFGITWLHFLWRLHGPLLSCWDVQCSVFCPAAKACLQWFGLSIYQ
jgi:hypothetical protein